MESHELICFLAVQSLPTYTDESNQFVCSQRVRENYSSSFVCTNRVRESYSSLDTVKIPQRLLLSKLLATKIKAHTQKEGGEHYSFVAFLLSDSGLVRRESYRKAEGPTPRINGMTKKKKWPMMHIQSFRVCFLLGKNRELVHKSWLDPGVCAHPDTMVMN